LIGKSAKIRRLADSACSRTETHELTVYLPTIRQVNRARVTGLGGGSFSIGANQG